MADHPETLPQTFEGLCEVVSRFPGWHRAQYAMAIALAQRNRLDEAITYFRVAADLDPDFAEGRFSLGGALIMRNARLADFIEAESHFRAAVDLKPDWAAGLDGLATVLRYLKREGEAEPLLRKLLDLSPDAARPRFYLAHALYQKGEMAEAEKWMRAAVELDGGWEEAKHDLADLERIRARKTKADRGPRFVRYPDTADLFADPAALARKFLLAEFADARPILSAQSRVVTVGSCFATYLGGSLGRYGIGVTNVPIGEQVNTTFANLELLRTVATGAPGPNHERICELFPTASQQALRRSLVDGTAFVYSLGVGACFFDRESGGFVMPRSSRISMRSLASDFEFRTTTVEENTRNLMEIIETVRTLNERMTIVLTLSPVPISVSFEFPSAIAADCLSKSVQRVAVNEVMKRGVPGVIYWPSFELVRWIGAHTGPVFGTEDGNSHHVSGWLVDTVIDLFVEYFGEESLSAEARRKSAEHGSVDGGNPLALR